MDQFVPCLVPPRLPTEDGDLNPSSVLLDDRAYIAAAAVHNATTAVGSLSTGSPVHVSFCLARAPRLSYICVHFPGAASGPAVGTLFGPAEGTPAVQCVREPPHVISTDADLALIRVPIPGAQSLNNDYDYLVYTARPQPGACSLELLPKPDSGFRDTEAAILRCPGSRYIIACLRNTLNIKEFRLQLYSSDTRRWSTRLLHLDAPERDKVLPIPDTANKLLFHNNTKVITLGGPNGTVGWVDLWRGILFCNVLDEKPVLRDMPLPKPGKSNKRRFCRGCAHLYRDITITSNEKNIKVIKYVEMETRPGVVLLSSSQPPVDHSGSESDSGDENVADYWKFTVWNMPVPISSWKDWHKDCTVDVTDIVIDNPKHSDMLLPLPRHTADPEDAKWSLRRLITAHPTLDGDAIYFLSKVDVMDDKGWVIAVNMRDRKLNGVAELDHRKNSSFRRYYVPSEISKYMIKSTVCYQEDGCQMGSTNARKQGEAGT